MHHILVATDLAPKSAVAVERACRLASEHCAALHLLHVEGRTSPDADFETAAARLAAIAGEAGVLHPCIAGITTSVRTGGVAQAVRRAAGEMGADLIVVGGHGDIRWSDEVFGTSAERLIRKVAQPVLIVHRPVDGPYRRVLAAVDKGAAAEDVLALACRMTSAETVFAVHAFLPSIFDLMRDCGDQARATEQGELERIIASTLGDRADLALHVEPVVRAGDPLSVIGRATREFRPDLLAIATRGRSRLSLSVQGSFAGAMIERGGADLLIHHVPDRSSGPSGDDARQEAI